MFRDASLSHSFKKSKQLIEGRERCCRGSGELAFDQWYESMELRVGDVKLKQMSEEVGKNRTTLYDHLAQRIEMLDVLYKDVLQRNNLSRISTEPLQACFRRGDFGLNRAQQTLFSSLARLRFVIGPQGMEKVQAGDIRRASRYQDAILELHQGLSELKARSCHFVSQGEDPRPCTRFH